MDVIPLDIPAVKLLRPPRYEDARGFFSEIYSRHAFSIGEIPEDFVQDNCSFSKIAGTVRGLHFQIPPMAQAKLILVLNGRVRDIAVDCRRGSPSYGRHVSVELAAQDWKQLFVPVGFAHGYCTLEPDTMVFYKASAPYAPELDRGIMWNDPDLEIDWPVRKQQAILSEKDRRLPPFQSLGDHFRYFPGE
jgi:dTDP-4-dehydrorhamnose 3,5-epimerase